MGGLIDCVVENFNSLCKCQGVLSSRRREKSFSKMPFLELEAQDLNHAQTCQINRNLIFVLIWFNIYIFGDTFELKNDTTELIYSNDKSRLQRCTVEQGEHPILMTYTMYEYANQTV